MLAWGAVAVIGSTVDNSRLLAAQCEFYDSSLLPSDVLTQREPGALKSLLHAFVPSSHQVEVQNTLTGVWVGATVIGVEADNLRVHYDGLTRENIELNYRVNVEPTSEYDELINIYSERLNQNGVLSLQKALQHGYSSTITALNASLSMIQLPDEEYASSEEVCENTAHSKEKCNSIGCCEFTDGACWGAKGKNKCFAETESPVTTATDMLPDGVTIEYCTGERHWTGQDQSMDLRKSSISAIEPDFHGQFPATLKYLQLDDNDIEILSAGMFANLPELQTLDLRNNKISKINEGTFKGLDSLTTLSLSGNQLGALDATMFEGLNELTTLHLQGNIISKLKAGTFAQTPKLQYLYLQDNLLWNPDDIEEEAFSNTAIEHLYGPSTIREKAMQQGVLRVTVLH